MTEAAAISKETLKRARELLGQGKVKNIFFSGGTYQIEVIDDEDYWIFLHIDDEANLIDQFCTCAEAETTGMCPHLAAGKLAILRGHKEPLHVRFISSFWNQLFHIIAGQFGYSQSILIRDGERFSCVKQGNAFEIRFKTPDAIEKAEDWIVNRKEETEETSIKFSNLDLKELELWRKKRPSLAFQYELSIWSDLARWAMTLEDSGIPIAITFADYEEGLPKKMKVSTEVFEMEVSIPRADWPKLIPQIGNYQNEIKIFPFKDLVIEKITYDEDNCAFIITSKPLPMKEGKNGVIEWEEWIFRPKVGFFPKKADTMLQKGYIGSEDVSQFLTKYLGLIEEYLEGVVINKKPLEASYHLFFSKDENLHIQPYLFEEGDLSRGKSHFFDPWGYLEGRGFYKLTNLLFTGTEKVITKEAMPEFIERNKLWLGKFEAFKIHLTSVESKLIYQVVGDTLKIKTDETFFEKGSELIHFDRWIYLKGHGFFSRGVKSLQRMPLFPQEVEGKDITNFIRANRDELEQIRGFYSNESGLQKTGLVVTLKEGKSIHIEPVFSFVPWAKERNPKVFDDFVYIPQKGFAEIPDSMKLPSKYTTAVTIAPHEVAYFLKHELPRMKPFLIHLDTQLIEPNKLKLSLAHIKEKEGNWLLDLRYVSAYGEVSLKDVYDSIMSFSPYFLSPAGMITLKDKRFHWLMKIARTAFDKNNSWLSLSTLDWIRLSIFEEIELPESEDEEEKRCISMLSNLQGMHISELPNVKGLKSTLRPYQEIGVRWLWFLYSYGLSGFLCDEMGLGKTHQAMALISAIMNQTKKSMRSKFLVVCPTSVIYHWQELLENFLNKARVHFYHGSFRSPKQLKSSRHDVILTTYGILRSDKELFAKEEFEVAIFDEMHIAKNRKSQIHKALRLLNARMKLALTGTPVENQLSELKALFDILLPNFLPPMQEFKEEFIIPIEKGGDPEKQKALALLIKPFVLRRKKQEVLADLPEKIEEIAYVDLSDEQKQLYQQIALQSKELMNEEGKNFYMHVFALLNLLKQVCDHPALISKDIDHYYKHESGKWELFLELLEETRASKQKLVVFTQYLGMLDIFELYLKGENIGYASIRGSTRDRKEEMKRFQTDPTCEVFVGSLQAAGVGIDLTAASVVIHFDRWWNPAKEDQATDRVHRIGQNRGVSVFKFVSKNTIEENIHCLIEKKKRLIQDIIGFDSEDELKTLDKKELLELLQQIYKQAADTT